MDVLTVECLKINDLDFKGLVTFEEARVKIFMQALGLPAILLHSIKMNYDKVRTTSFKLANQINFEDLTGHEEFTFQREYASE